MQADELVGEVDGDYDGVTGELSVGDVTAMTIYMAALKRPTSLMELAELGLADLDPDLSAAIAAGEARFAEIGCAGCHTPQMVIDDPVFSEPSANPAFAEATMPSGVPADDVGLSASTAVRFDLTADQPNNLVVMAEDDPDAAPTPLGVFPTTDAGQAIVAWYSDFRTHEMGPELADPVDAYGVGASVWPTRSLAGVGTTGPWLHNGHATTLDDAIRAHGGEAAASQAAYVALPEEARDEIEAFLTNLVFVDLDPEDDGAH
jgi:mono/diheme cytochrome c family protein